jgi:hypothetical protein
MIKKCKQLGKMPVFYAYVTAFEIKARLNVQDCDVHPTNNLCAKGANYIRQNRNHLVGRYRHHAQSIATALGDRNARIYSICFFCFI